MDDPIVLLVKAQGNKDPMYYHQAVKQDNKDHFFQAILKGFDAHVRNKN